MRVLLVSAAAALAWATQSCKDHPLLDPACWALKSPAAYNVTLTVLGLPLTISIERKWAPLGADRFYNLAKYSYLSSETEPDNNAGFFRVVPGFVVQFGIAGNATVAKASEGAIIDNDPVVLSNVRGERAPPHADCRDSARARRWGAVEHAIHLPIIAPPLISLPSPSPPPGTIAYAAEQDPVTGKACNRTTQVYINYADNANLDALGFTPFGVISVEDMSSIVDKIDAQYGQDPDQGSIYGDGDVYLRKNFPKLTYVTATRVTE